MEKKNITFNDVDWEDYKQSVLCQIENERVWGFGGNEFADENILSLENELELINNEEFEELFNKYDIDIWENYVKVNTDTKVYLTIAECLSTDGEFSSDVYVSHSIQESAELASSLIADMCDIMDLDDIDCTTQWEIGDEDWWYRVRIEEQNF